MTEDAGHVVQSVPHLVDLTAPPPPPRLSPTPLSPLLTILSQASIPQNFSSIFFKSGRPYLKIKALLPRFFRKANGGLSPSTFLCSACGPIALLFFTLLVRAPCALLESFPELSHPFPCLQTAVLPLRTFQNVGVRRMLPSVVTAFPATILAWETKPGWTSFPPPLLRFNGAHTESFQQILLIPTWSYPVPVAGRFFPFELPKIAARPIGGFSNISYSPPLFFFGASKVFLEFFFGFGHKISSPAPCLRPSR